MGSRGEDLSDAQTHEEGTGLAGTGEDLGLEGHSEADTPSVGKTAKWIQLLLQEGSVGREKTHCQAELTGTASRKEAHGQQTPCRLPLAPPIGIS